MKIKIVERRTSLISAVISIVIGSLFIWLRGGVLDIIIFVAGLLLAADGLFRGLLYIKRENLLPFTPVAGILEIVLGVFIAVATALGTNFHVYLFVLVGTALIVYSILAIIELSNIKAKWTMWIVILLVLTVGIFLSILPFLNEEVYETFLIILGSIALAHGIFSLIVLI